MPRSTARFQFEWKMLAWAAKFSRLLAGENRCFLLLTDADGAVRQLLIGENEYEYDKDTWQAHMQSHPSWLFYHPFDGPVYTFMRWQGIERCTIERLVGGNLEDEHPAGPLPGSRLDETEGGEFPSSWMVMF